ncbi:hypothetical protein niasHT_013585 [Heterodera trifolii]|uniref:Uncharacterized protein n=1 Tax=Heterodera trifolii TaxID=157864 RepID=A0ABD2LE31_9BILA
MPVFALQMSANLVGVTDLRPSDYDDHRWYLKLKCSACGESYPSEQYATIRETHTLTKGKGICHISSKCSFCGRINSLEILIDSYASYSADKNRLFQTLVKFECRGIEPTSFDPRIGWICVGTESGSIFDEIDLNELEWADYDEKNSSPVEINDISFRFVRV